MLLRRLKSYRSVLHLMKRNWIKFSKNQDIGDWSWQQKPCWCSQSTDGGVKCNQQATRAGLRTGCSWRTPWCNWLCKRYRRYPYRGRMSKRERWRFEHTNEWIGWRVPLWCCYEKYPYGYCYPYKDTAVTNVAIELPHHACLINVL